MLKLSNLGTKRTNHSLADARRKTTTTPAMGRVAATKKKSKRFDGYDDARDRDDDGDDDARQKK